MRRWPWPWLAVVLGFMSGVTAPISFADDPFVSMGWWASGAFGLMGVLYLLVDLYLERRGQ
jgi:hypothetical protein